MKFRIKEVIFNNIHLYFPQIKNNTISKGYELNIKHFIDNDDPEWSSINSLCCLTYDEAKKVCDDTTQVEKDRKIIIHELPERD